MMESNDESTDENQTDSNAGETTNMEVQIDSLLNRSRSTQTEWSWLENFAGTKNASFELKNSKSHTKIMDDSNMMKNDTMTDESFRSKTPEIEKDHNLSSQAFSEDVLNLKSKVEGIDNFADDTVLEHSANVHDQMENYLSDSELDSLSDESEDEMDLHFPSVGPPQMLQHLRESFHNFSGNQRPDKLTDLGENEKGLQKSFFSGPCQYCGQSILPLPTVKEIEKLPNKQLYCCYEYEDFMKLYISYDEKKHVQDEIIDIKPHAPYGTKAARKAAKERAAERMREKEIERQKAVTAQSNFFSFTRQVKTVQYALSSSKCMEEGWTLRPETPVKEPDLNEMDHFSIEVNSTLLQNKNELYQRYYEDGKKFLVIYPDGTGCCFYPSGNVAVMIIATERGKYTYILQKDSDDYDTDNTGILAVFEPNGNASCYFKDGSLRILLTPFYGIQMDKFGNYKKKWQWYFIKGHVHAPPFQPICFSLNKQLSCRVMEQDNIVVSFSSGQRTVRFKVGAKLKARKKTIPPILRNEDAQFIDFMQKKVQALTEKINLTIRFPKSPKLEVLVSRSQNPPRRKSTKGELQLPKIKNREPSVFVN